MWALQINMITDSTGVGGTGSVYPREEMRHTCSPGKPPRVPLSDCGLRDGGSYRVDPVDVVGDPGEDRWLAGVVAAQRRAEAHDAMHLPLAVRCLAIQWSARVPLRMPELGVKGGRGCPVGPGS